MSVTAIASHYCFPLWNVELDIVRKDKQITSMKLQSWDNYCDTKFIEGKLVPHADIIKTLLKFAGVGADRMTSNIDYKDMIQIVYNIKFTIPVKILIGEKSFECASMGKVIKNVVGSFSRRSVDMDGKLKAHEFDSDRVKFCLEGDAIKVSY